MRSDQPPEAPRNAARHQAGLTLVELLVTMVILSVLTSMILVTWFALQNSFTDQARANEARDISREAMSRMVREIRDASSPGIQAVVYAGQERVSFYTTFNDPGASDGGFGTLLLTTFEYKEGLTNGVGRIVRYRDVNATPLDLSDDRATVIADRVLHYSGSPPIFSYWYFDANGSPSKVFPVPDSRMQYIYAVEIDMVVDMNGDKPPAPVHLDSMAQIRNARPL